jgi:indolepyruvate ferredoxin oxidoreductase
MIMDEKQVGDIIGVAQMGGEGGMWMGMSAFTDVPHIYQNIGDGTFMHSGSLAVRAAVASGVNITYKLLYNSAVAMTGGQTPVGEMAAPQIVALLLAEGVKKVIITTEDTARYRKVRLPKGVEVLDRSKLVEAEERLAQIEGVTVLLHDQECAAEKRRKRKRGKMHDPQTRIFINERVCEGCGDCGEKSNCLSVEPVDTEFGRKTRINQSSCNKDYTCLGGDCPSFVEVVPAKRTAVTAATSLSAADIAEPLHRVDSDDFAMRITGIGGTGVVTVAQILATAATLDGLNVRGLDQTGMAQKGGPVVSDLRFTLGDQPRANKLAEDDCDLYLGCDVLVAAADANIEAASPARTFAVVSSAVVPTGSMVIDTDVSFPDLASLQERIANRVRPDGMHLIDARSLTQALFGSSQCENMFLVGVALQTGALPLTTKSIESAITLNGVAVEANLQAFRRGRQYIADGAEVETLARDRGRQAHAARRARRESEAAELVALVDTAPGTALHRLVSIRTAELIAYQNRRYAERYVRRVEAVRRWEAQTLQTDGAYAIAVATALFKLMAYKDESEVARLSIDGELQAAITEEFGPGARFAWKLHPPIFRALGLNHKITLGPWFKPIYQVLYLLRHLRGTPLNPFGLGNVRKLERTLIDEYVTGLEQIEQTATPQTQHLAIEIASLPDMIRGYEHIKARNVDRYRARRDELMRQLAGTEQPAAVR